MKKITVTSETAAAMNDFYGIFFEDINHSADGGLYAEMIRNRAFEFSPADNPAYQPLTAWKRIEEGGASVSAHVSDKLPYTSKNPHYLVLEIAKAGSRAGIKNLGWGGGIAVSGDKSYNFSCYARADKPCRVTVSVDDAYGNPLMQTEIEISSPQWTKYTALLTSSATDSSCVFAVTTNEPCKFCMDFVSLFPCDTYKNRENGLRVDIADMLEALKPRFVRFPGGCLVHDGTLNADDRNSMYRWKNTIGAVTERSARRNNWRYNQTLGLGYYEYFLFCEDIGAKPLPVLPAGYNPHMEQAAPLDEMQEWVDDALDLIEFANGDRSTKWGSIRAEMGHSEPFNLEYLAIGNEEVGQGFWDRYDILHKEIRAKHPEIKLINSAGPFPAGGEFERGWSNAVKNGSDFVDEHYYTSPEWMIANTHRYDNYPEAPKVFLGEFASWGNEFRNALIEAAYMTSLENNAKSVALVCYAPLLANAGYVDWKPDMIWFDNHRVYGSANYYVQKMFMNNTGTRLLKTEAGGFEKPVRDDDMAIAGEIELTANMCGAVFKDIAVTDISNGTSVIIDSTEFERGGTIPLGTVNSRKYSVELTAKRTFGDKGFFLDFGKSSDNNYIRWFIGGWANQDSEINAQINGHGSTLDHNIFSVMTGREYKLRLEVDGRRISTYIDGVKMNGAEDKLPYEEELYFTASSDDENIYFKAVNIRDTETTATVCAEELSKIDAQVLTLTAPLDAMNDFDNPSRVSPYTSCITKDGSGFDYTFAPHSVTVFKLKK